MDERTVMAVCIADEAANQSHAGRVAVGMVVRNRTRLKYSSDGSVLGTVLSPGQFSGFWFDMVAGKYTRVATTMDQALVRLADKYRRYSALRTLWADCLLAASEALGIASMPPETANAVHGITPATVLYYNPRIVPKRPAWALADHVDAVVGDHTFFHA